MATSFSANQYQNAFLPKKLSNWGVPSFRREHTTGNLSYPVELTLSGQRPRSLDGFTQIIGNGRGHILPGIARSSKNPWGDHVGTWDLPKRIPGNCAKVTTARTSHGLDKLLVQYDAADQVLSGKNKNNTRMDKGRLPALSGPVPLAPSSGRRSGAEAPGSKMLEDGSPAGKSGSPMAKLTSPRRTPCSPMMNTARSPIPNISDVPWGVARSPSPPVKSPPCPRYQDGLGAL